MDELELSVRSANCFEERQHQCLRIGDLIQKSEGETLRTPNLAASR
ncbi:MAG: DNA-directed RNA polymerase subunit alpha C-terminal domain-containing protein [Hyphomonadaceae bacterium]